MSAQPIQSVECDTFEIVLGLDLPENDQLLHEIRLPVDLLEYPDVLQARWLTARLERVGHEGNARTMHCVHLHAGPDTKYSPPPYSCGIQICRKSDSRPDMSKSRNTLPLLGQSPSI
jgi:hypothetical protein